MGSEGHKQIEECCRLLPTRTRNVSPFLVFVLARASFKSLRSLKNVLITVKSLMDWQLHRDYISTYDRKHTALRLLKVSRYKAPELWNSPWKCAAGALHNLSDCPIQNLHSNVHFSIQAPICSLFWMDVLLLLYYLWKMLPNHTRILFNEQLIVERRPNIHMFV